MTDYTTLIDTLTLASLGDQCAIVDCRSSLTDPDFGARAYAEGHIPGSVFANLDKDLSRPAEPHEGRHPLPDPHVFMQWLGENGIAPDTQVVAYDDVSGAIAGRLWWMLSKWLGHHRVAVLDGGIRKWIAEERALSTEAPRRAPATYAASVNDDACITTDELTKALAAGTVTVVDARTDVRFRGEDEPIDPVAGHIPGSVNLFLGGNLSNGCYVDANQLSDRFKPVVEAAGGTSAVVHSCGSGVSALHNMIAMEQAGLSGSRLYVGSWSEWIRDEKREIATGA